MWALNENVIMTIREKNVQLRKWTAICFRLAVVLVFIFGQARAHIISFSQAGDQCVAMAKCYFIIASAMAEYDKQQ